MERELCNICLEEIHSFNSYTTPCFHSFHYECIYKWFAHNVRNHSNKTCPVCRTNLITQFNPVFTYIYSSKFYSFFDNTFIYHTMTQENFFKYVNDSYFDPNIQNFYGYTPLFYSIRHNNIDTARELLALPSILPHIPNNTGHSPLQYSIGYSLRPIISLFEKNNFVPRPLKSLI